ncbi:MAG: hypothetical protein FWH42_04090 [Dehalococcoidia bacterium]|nr:hypothetical protein [Dehalococcoidia bacterium]
MARITVFAGHFGSGKTSLAISYAIYASKQRDKVILCDLDIINPYSRMAEAVDALKEKGIRLVTSCLSNTNVDAPALPAGTRALFDVPDTTGIIDVGGDNRGALALGRYASYLQNSADYEMLLVFNQFRPLTSSIGALLDMKNEIETASQISFTGLVNNSNLMEETKLADVVSSGNFALKASEKLALPLKMTVLERRLVPSQAHLEKILGDIFLLDLFKSPWKP